MSRTVYHGVAYWLDGKAVVECACGHRSFGTWLGAVWAVNDARGGTDAWRIHAKHEDECHPVDWDGSLPEPVRVVSV